MASYEAIGWIDISPCINLLNGNFTGVGLSQNNKANKQSSRKSPFDLSIQGDTVI